MPLTGIKELGGTLYGQLEAGFGEVAHVLMMHQAVALQGSHSDLLYDRSDFDQLLATVANNCGPDPTLVRIE